MYFPPWNLRRARRGITTGILHIRLNSTSRTVISGRWLDFKAGRCAKWPFSISQEYVYCNRLPFQCTVMRRGIAIGLVLGSAAQPAHATGQTTFGTELGTPPVSPITIENLSIGRGESLKVADQTWTEVKRRRVNDQRLVAKMDTRMITYNIWYHMMTNMDTGSEAADTVWCNTDRALQDLEHRGIKYHVAPAEHLLAVCRFCERSYWSNCGQQKSLGQAESWWVLDTRLGWDPPHAMLPWLLRDIQMYPRMHPQHPEKWGSD